MALSNKDLTLELRESAEAIRQNVIEFLTTEIGSSVFEMWFGDLNNILIDERRLIIQADSPFALNQISLKYGATFQKAARHICGPRYQVHYRLTPRGSANTGIGVNSANQHDGESGGCLAAKTGGESTRPDRADDKLSTGPAEIEKTPAALEMRHGAHGRRPGTAFPCRLPALDGNPTSVPMELPRTPVCNARRGGWTRSSLAPTTDWPKLVSPRCSSASANSHRC